MQSGRMDPLVSLWFYVQRKNTANTAKNSDNTAITMNKQVATEWTLAM